MSFIGRKHILLLLSNTIHGTLHINSDRIIEHLQIYNPWRQLLYTSSKEGILTSSTCESESILFNQNHSRW